MSDRTRSQPGDTEPVRPAIVRILAVGALREGSDLPALLDAFEAVTHWNPRARLIVVGDGPERHTFAASITERKIAGAVGLPGALEPFRMAELVQRAHVFVHLTPDASAGGRVVPSTLPAALAGGLCVVAIRSRGVARLIVDGVNGLLVEPGDGADLRRALHRVVTDVRLRSDLGAAAAAAIHGSLGPPLVGVRRRSA